MKLSEAIERYVRTKRVSGLAYDTEAAVLSAFRRYVNDLRIEEVTPKQVVEFLNIRRCSNGRWMMKHSCLRMFFEFWTDRAGMSVLTMPQPKRSERDSAVTPCIFTRDEVGRLIQAALGNQSHQLCAMSGMTFRIVLLTLYGTGARAGEILSLKREDLDMKRGLISLCGDRKLLPRRVPLNQHLHEELSQYLQSEGRRSVRSGPNVFVSCSGKPLRVPMIGGSFARLRARTAIARSGAGMRRPQIRDLRDTFAVHRIASWISEGADLNRMLPALSGYMGLSGLCSVQRFLRMTPERFKRALDELSPTESRKHWRDDPISMRFLARL